MKNIILVKSHPCVQIAHLYEHLFLRAVNDKFFESKLYKVLDYNAHGSTYNDSGIVLLDCDFFSNESETFRDSILKLRIDLSDGYDKLHTALWQMSAELPYKLKSDSFEDIIAGLKKLDEQEWKNIDDITWIDTKKMRRQTSPLYITNIKSKPKKITLSLLLDKTLSDSNPELLPLYYIISRMILYNVNTRLAYKLGVYESTDITINPKTSKATSILLYYPRSIAVKATQEDLNVLMAYSKEVISDIFSEETISRLINDLSDISYSENILHTPNYEEILDTTHVLMGSMGWKKIATVENVKRVISNIDLEIKDSKFKVTERIK